MKIVRTADYDSLEKIRPMLARPHLDEVRVSPNAAARTRQIFGEDLTPVQAVERIITDIKRDGTAALLDYVAKIDGTRLTANELLVTPEEFQAAARAVSAEFRQALRLAITNVRRFHEKQKTNSWITTEENGVILGQRVIPLERVGIYVPGGNAPLVSSLVMSAVPAKVAEVEEIWMATPLRAGKIDPHLLVAAQECGVTGILKAGGAQAIAALAYGIDQVPAVDKIVGPGNLFVTLAKKLVFGRVGVESLAGPSEILVLADETAPASYIAADLLSQAEHDWEAASCLITTSAALAKEVAEEIDRQLPQLASEAVARESLDRWGLLVITRDLDEAVELANIFAAEHLELMVADPWAVLGRIRHAGAVFLGKYSSEPIGDYAAGPNHILPTNGTARFSSPLSTDDFVKKSSVISYTSAALAQVGPQAAHLADTEGLPAHAQALRIRLADLKEGDGRD